MIRPRYTNTIMKPCYQILIISLLLSIGMYAQDTVQCSKKTALKHSVGIGNGYTTGYGALYRFQPKKLGVQVMFALQSGARNVRCNSSLAFFYTLWRRKNLSIMAYQSNLYRYRKETQFYTPDGELSESVTSNKTILKKNQFSHGIGAGVEILLLDCIGLNLLTGYGIFNHAAYFHPSIEGAVYYKF